MNLSALISALGDPLNLSFVIVLSVIWIFFFGMTFRRPETAGAVGPSILTSIGIFGTFLGVFLGLIEFDTSNIKASTPQLLDGLKTAFLSSVVGLLYAVFIKFALVLRAVFSRGTVKSTSIEGLLSELVIGVKETNKALRGDSETSIGNQIRLARSEMVDGLSQLNKEFREFSQTMAEVNSDALISALQEVIKDFNAKINEQFGENFKHLNAAVEKLVVWQDNYKVQLEQTDVTLREAIDLHKITTERIATAMSDLEKVAGLGQEMSKVTEKLGSLLEKNEAVLSTSVTSLTQLSEVGERAKNAFPAINKNIEELTEKLKEQVTVQLSKMEKLVALQNEQYNKAFESLRENLQKSQTQMEDFLHQSTADASKMLQKLNSDQEESIKRNLNAIDEALGKELESALNGFGGHLVKISTRLTQDYEPLTEKLRDLIEVSRRVG